MDGRAHAVAQNTKNAHTWACGGSHRRQTMAAPVLRSRAPSGRRSVPALRTASPGAGSGSPLPPQWSPAPAPVHRGADVWSSGWAACRRDTSAPLPTWLVPSRSPPALYETLNQRCWNHKIVNVLAKLPKRQQDQAKLMLRTIPYAPTRTEAEWLRTVFTRWCGDHSYEAASEALERDWDRMVTFYDFPKGALGAPSHDEPARITLRGPQASDRCRQALQEGRSGDSGDLENVDGCRTALQASEGP